MNISLDYKNEKPFPNKPSGGYEWWYFDAISSDKEWSFVIIFYQGNPFSPKYIQDINDHRASPEDYPALSISLYNRNKTEYYSFIEYPKEAFIWDEGVNSCQIGAHTFKKEVQDDELIYTLSINEQLASGHAFKGKIKFKSSIVHSSLFEIEKKSTEHHFWNLIQPRAAVTGLLDIKGKSDDHHIDFVGSGYHDHNLGLEPMKDDFKDWYWGRYHFEEATLIYYVMNKKSDKQYQAWLINNDNQQIIDTFTFAELEGKLSNLFGLRSSRKVILKSDDAEITIQTPVALDDGPFYQRFLGQAVMNTEKTVSVAEGISEYISPSNIYKKKFWPAVKMRLRFANHKPHWVQRFKVFYEWTW